jgi:hypothetical protein
VWLFSVEIHLFPARSLYNNSLTGSITSTIAQLSALTLLFVVMLFERPFSSCFPHSQESFWQSANWPDFFDDWTVDETQAPVRCAPCLLTIQCCSSLFVPRTTEVFTTTS